jgi:hypothetical protein|tara:strand:+ start:2191 stop:3090 length:900 start_codon:yes stop_codon:yes gene_type:complete
MAETVTQSVISREAPEVEAMKLALMQQALERSKQAKTLPQYQVAGFNQAQRDALAASGLGAFEDLLTAGTGTLSDAVDAYAGTGAAFDPASISDFMNPFEDQAVAQALSDIRREGEIAQTNLDAQAVGAGAFGGSRAAIAQGELGRNVMDQQARTAAQMRAAGFESAAERARASFEAQQARQQALAAGLAALGGQRLGAAEVDQALRFRDIEGRFGLGQLEQQQRQNVLDAERQSRLQQEFEPEQRLAFLGDIYSGAPSSSQQLTTATSPGASPFQQIAGYGIAGLSAAAGAKQLGLFG